MAPINGDKLRGHLEAIVLPTLDQGEADGQAIQHHQEEADCGHLWLTEGSLYPALYRIGAAGEVKAVWESDPLGQHGARGRIYQ